MPATAITSTVVAEYIRTIKLDYNQVTTNGYLQKVKTIVKYGMSKGLIKVDPFVGVRIRRGEMEVQFLSTEEVIRIRDTDFKNDSLNRIRDLFVFQASSGLSYCDMAALRPSDFQKTKDGYLFIHKMEKSRASAPLNRSSLTLCAKIWLTPCAKIILTPYKNLQQRY